MRSSKQELVEEAVEIILRDFNYESIIPFEYLESLFGAAREETLFSFMIGCTKNKLIERGFVLRPLINEGYTILHPREVADYVMNTSVVQSLNKIKKGVKTLYYTNRNILNKEELKRLTDLEKFLIELESDNENKILTMQLQLNEARALELSE